MGSLWMKLRIYTPLAVFAVCFIALSVLYVPSNTRVEYIYPCEDVAYLGRILPLTCGKVVYTYVPGKVVANISGVVIDVAMVANRALVPVDEELYGLYKYCCETTHQPIKSIDFTSLAINIVASLLISAVLSLVTYYILRRVEVERSR